MARVGDKRYYWNLHKKLYSEQTYMETHGGKYWKVTAHKHEVFIACALPTVSQAGRNRVLVERCKNVHAYLYVSTLDVHSLDETRQEITYNPYKYTSFIRKDTEQPIFLARNVHMSIVNEKPMITGLV